MLLSIFFFILAGLAEIGGGYLVWLYMRDDKGPVYLLAGAIILFLYGLIPTFQPEASSVRFMQPTVAYLLPFPSYGAGSSMVCDQTHMISSVVSSALWAFISSCTRRVKYKEYNCYSCTLFLCLFLCLFPCL